MNTHVTFREEKAKMLFKNLKPNLMRHRVHLRSFVLDIAGYERNL